jgi:hypothetical protein
MLKRGLILLLALTGSLSAVTLEVVQLFQPLSLHGTDGVGDEKDDEVPIQATVMSRPMAIAGAIPEDLVKAIATPCKILSNSPAYDVADANLLNLCKLKMVVEMKGEILTVRFDVTELAIPDDVDVTARQVLRLSISAVRRTLKEYFKHSHDSLEVSIGVTGTNDGNASLKDLAVRFKAGE